MESVAASVRLIFSEKKYADKVIESNLKYYKKWGSRDRRFYAESVYEMVRWWRFLWWLKGDAPLDDLTSLKELWAYWWIWKHGEIPDLFREKFQAQGVGDKIQAALKQEPPPAIRHSIPDWLYERGVEELGEEKWLQTLPYLNKQALVYLRKNSLKVTSALDLISALKDEEVLLDKVALEGADDTFALKERKNVFSTETFKKGFFEVQDLSSQLIAPLLDVAPGMRVIDACAGAGGKSLHLAALMKNKGKLIAMDIHEWKLKELRKRAARNGVDIIEVKVIEGQKTLKRLSESADRLLLDVPCTGIGVLRRNPDAKWKLTPEELSRLNVLQKEIINSYSRLLKPGGKMVYSTCSILPSENQEVVKDFLSKQPQFTLLKEKIILPQDFNSDGFYAALLERKS